MLNRSNPDDKRQAERQNRLSSKKLILCQFKVDVDFEICKNFCSKLKKIGAKLCSCAWNDLWDSIG